MKKIILTTICSFIFLFGFSQDKSPDSKIAIKKNAQKVSEYLKSELKLNKEQTQRCLDAFAQYAWNMQQVEEKSNTRNLSEQDKKKQLTNMMLKFAKQRDSKLQSVFSEKQLKLYSQKTSRVIHPFTLEIIKEKESKKRN